MSRNLSENVVKASATSLLPLHCEAKGFVSAPADRVFAYVDDHARLASHMSKPSWKMGGGRMSIEVDQAQGRRVGSRIRLAGRVFGIDLCVEEIVTQYAPPYRKTWETVDSPRLLVIGQYRMGFELTPHEAGSVLRVFVDYSLPEHGAAHWLGRLFARYYARWCTEQMLDDTTRHFSRT